MLDYTLPTLEAKLLTDMWQKSSESGPNTDACVQARLLADGGIEVGDTKNLAGPTLTFTPAEWNAFIGGVKDGEFDLA